MRQARAGFEQGRKIHVLVKNRYLAAKTRAFVDFLADRFGDGAEWDRFRRSTRPIILHRHAALPKFLCASENLGLRWPH